MFGREDGADRGEDDGAGESIDESRIESDGANEDGGGGGDGDGESRIDPAEVMPEEGSQPASPDPDDGSTPAPPTATESVEPSPEAADVALAPASSAVAELRPAAPLPDRAANDATALGPRLAATSGAEYLGDGVFQVGSHGGTRVEVQRTYGGLKHHRTDRGAVIELPRGLAGAELERAMTSQLRALGAPARAGGAGKAGASATPASPAIEKKEGSAGLPDTETKATIRFTREVPIPRLGAKLILRWEVSVKDSGDAKVKAGAASASLGSQQAVLERKTRELDAKIQTALLKGGFDPFNGGTLNVGGVALSLKLDGKLFEGGLSLKRGFSLKAAVVGLQGEADFGSFLPDALAGRAELKGVIRLEKELGADVVSSVVRLGQASDDLDRLARTEKALKESSEELQRYRRAKSELSKVPTAKRNLEHTLELQRIEKELEAIERRHSKLAKTRKALGKVKDKALKTIKEAGKALQKTPVGKAVSKLASKALMVTFKKFVPIYNVLSTAHDLYEIGEALVSINWSNLFDRVMGDNDAIGGGVTGTAQGKSGVAGDGTTKAKKEQPETSVSPEQPTGANDDLALAPHELEFNEAPQLSPAAKSVVDALISGDGQGAQQLSREDAEAINALVPVDLTAEEVAQVHAKLVAKGIVQVDLVEAVTGAMQQVRPFGEKRPDLSSEEEKEANRSRSAVSSSTPKQTSKRKEKPSQSRAVTRADVERYLRGTVSLVDPVVGKVEAPERFNLGDFGFEVASTRASRVLAADDDSFLVHVVVHVTHAPAPSTAPSAIRFGQQLEFHLEIDPSIIVRGRQP
ncbi:MAG: hypothetical protein ACTHU0_05215 [Kofleriaceae bacterium]